MWIHVCDGILYNTNCLGTIYVEEGIINEEQHDVMATFLKDSKSTLLGAYGSEEEAEFVTNEIFYAIKRGEAAYIMPSRRKMDFLGKSLLSKKAKQKTETQEE